MLGNLESFLATIAELYFGSLRSPRLIGIVGVGAERRRSKTGQLIVLAFRFDWVTKLYCRFSPENSIPHVPSAKRLASISKQVLFFKKKFASIEHTPLINSEISVFVKGENSAFA